MSLSIRKSPAFLLLLSGLAIFSPAVCAQNKIPAHAVSAELHSQFSPTESDAKAGLLSEKIRMGETADPPKTFRNAVGDQKNLYGTNNAVKTIRGMSARFDANHQTEINDFAYRFRSTGARERQLEFKNSADAENKSLSFRLSTVKSSSFDDPKKAASLDDSINAKAENFQWRSAIGQSLMFLAVQHGYALTQPKTREAMKGKFWKDYVQSAKSLGGWADGGRFFTNYIAHPMQGSLTGFIYVQNSPKERPLEFAESGAYWTSRLKAMAWTAVWSTQFEIGPVSQASIGNVGLKGKQTYIDIVVTPTIGTAMLIGEDAVDRLLIKRIERYSDSFYVRIFSRMLLNPTRNFSNLLRFKAPWYRDRPTAR